MLRSLKRLIQIDVLCWFLAGQGDIAGNSVGNGLSHPFQVFSVVNNQNGNFVAIHVGFQNELS